MRVGNRDTEYTFEWWDEAKQKIISTKPNYTQQTTWTSTYSYDSGGRVTQVAIADGQPRTVTFLTDGDGRVIQRKEGTALTDLYYSISGKTIGDVSSTSHLPAANPLHASFADFDQNYRPVSSMSEDTPGAYTVQTGDTLRTIATAIWGDGGLWYMLAEANGLTGSETLVAGQVLTIPNKVVNAKNTSETFKPYDPNEAIGANEPSRPEPLKYIAPPKKKGGCGGFGKILVMAVAIAVTIALRVPITGLFTAGTAAGSSAFVAGTIAGGAAAAAVGNVASQAVGIATGVQEEFSFKGVALSALSGGVGAGLAQISQLTGLSVLGSKFAGEMVQGAVTNALTQGLAVATGLQNKFDWTGVAVAGLGQAAGSVVKGTGFWADTGRTMADAAAGAAARSLVDGTSFGDNLISVLPDVIGRSIGNAVGNELAAAYVRHEAKRAAEKQAEARVAELGNHGVSASVAEDGTIRTNLTPAQIAEKLAAVNAVGVEVQYGQDPNIVFAGSDTFTQEVTAADGTIRYIKYTADPGIVATYSSVWIGSLETGAIRFISNGEGGSYVYDGSQDRIDGLGLSISYDSERGPSSLNTSSSAAGDRSSSRYGEIAYDFGMQLADTAVLLGGEYYKGATASPPWAAGKSGPKVYWNGWAGNGSVKTFNISRTISVAGKALPVISIVKDGYDLATGNLKGGAGEFALNTGVTLASVALGAAALGPAGIALGVGWVAFKYLAPDAHKATVDWANDSLDSISSTAYQVIK